MFGQGRFWPILPGLILGGGYYLVVELTVSEAAASLAAADLCACWGGDLVEAIVEGRSGRGLFWGGTTFHAFVLRLDFVLARRPDDAFFRRVSGGGDFAFLESFVVVAFFCGLFLFRVLLESWNGVVALESTALVVSLLVWEPFFRRSNGGGSEALASTPAGVLDFAFFLAGVRGSEALSKSDGKSWQGHGWSSRAAMTARPPVTMVVENGNPRRHLSLILLAKA